MARPSLYLVDGFAVAYRAYFALIRQPLINAKGQNVSAVFGVANALLDVIDTCEPDHLAFVIDVGKTFRHELLPSYKATRARMPDDMREQLDLMMDMVRAMGIPVLGRDGYEADDLMGTLARLGEDAGLDVTLVTGDKDFFQLVTEHARVMHPPKGGDAGKIFGREGVIEKFGVPPEHVTDVLALAGDAADNVPGVKGVGMKTAVKLVNEYGGLESVLAAAPNVKGKLGERLREQGDQARLCLELVIIDRNAPVELDLDAMKIGGRDETSLRELVLELDSRALMERLGVEGEKAEPWEFRLVVSEGELEALAVELRAEGVFTLDTETTSTDPMQADLVGISATADGRVGYYVPVAHQGGPNAELAVVRKVLGPLFADPSVGKIGQNIKYDLKVLARAGFEVAGVVFDTMVASYLVDSTSRQHNLDFLALRYLKHQMIPITRLIGEKRGKQEQKTMDEVGVEVAAEYAAEDAVMTHRLREIFRPRLTDMSLERLLEDVEVPLIPVLAKMEFAGVVVDVDLLAELSQRMEVASQKLEKQIHEEAGEEFNVNSPKQLQVILFERLGLKPIRRTKTGYSTDAAVLETLAAEHPVPRLIVENRELVKLRSTYVDALPRLVHPLTGRIHTSFQQAVAATGRLSSSNPNLQNIPIRTEIGREIRRAFVAGAEDRGLLSADYSQIELRILAHLSGDEHLSAAFAGGEDIHRRTAALVFGTPLDAVTSALRRRAKEVNFGIIYGMGAFGLASRLKISNAEAAEFIASYFDTFPRIREFVDATVARTRSQGYVTTILERRRYLPEINEGNRQTREFSERAAVNTAIQGSAADLIKVSMIRIDRRLRDLGLRTRMLLQVHDELVFEVPLDERETVDTLVREEMAGAIEMNVPLKVDTGFASNWLEAH